MSLGDVLAKVSFRGDLGARPRWAARLLSWGLDLADFEGVPIRLQGFEVQDATMLWSVFMGCAHPLFTALHPLLVQSVSLVCKVPCALGKSALAKLFW